MPDADTPASPRRPPQRQESVIEASAQNPRPRCLWLDEIRDEPVGGKAAGLAKLMEMGLPVPRGFVVLDATPGHLPEDLAESYRALGGGPVAVRSSAIGEDSEDASFAGQYETILDVRGETALREATLQCLASLESDRASAYQHERLAPDDEEGATAMCVVVQRMAEARAAGVLFTVDPVTGRRDRAVIDAVCGLGEALVSGHASPDHYVLDRSGATVHADLEGEVPILGDDERRALVDAAFEAEAREGMPLDLEWAIGERGEIQWLQARPITTLGADPNELDTTPVDPIHVYTRCNVGEMFPGACTPLSKSFTAWSIDVGMQRMHQKVGIQREIRDDFKFIAMFHGHLFLNLTTMGETATQALGSSTDQMALSVCGRHITEFEIGGAPPPPLPRRLANGVRYVRYLFGQRRARSAMKQLVDELEFPDAKDARAQWQAIDARFDAIFDAMDYHLISSAGSGVLTPTLLGVIAGGEEPEDRHHAEVAALLAGAGNVESADIVAGAERLQSAILDHPEGREHFIEADLDEAIAWLQSEASGEAGLAYARYMRRHGHRAIKELELRQPEWREDPRPLVRSIQLPLRRRSGSSIPSSRPPASTPPRTFPIRLLTRMARQAVRSREETKSGLVNVTTRFKEVYRRLARQCCEEGLLPDPDALFFLTHAELGRLTAGESELAAHAVGRRETFDYQESLQFPDVFQGRPEPLRPEALTSQGQDSVQGAPVSRGTVIGMARIIRSLEEAETLQEGEILIAPITDVGWTPYFSLIRGLVTDVGSAVSHGAVVAREYGLPAVVNTRIATSVFETGDRVVLDGDRGIVRLATDED